MQVVVKALPDLTPDEYKKCHRLNFRANGDMMYVLQDYKDDPTANAVMIWEGDVLQGWAITFYKTKRAKRVRAMFYVRSKARKKGLGSILFNEVNKIDRRPWVYPHDMASGAFFSKYRKQIRPVPDYGSYYLNHNARINR